MTSLTITHEDAINVIRMFHCLPEGTDITITGIGNNYTTDNCHLLFCEFVHYHSKGQMPLPKIPLIKKVRDIYSYTSIRIKESRELIDEVLLHFPSGNVTEGQLYDYLKNHNIEP